MLMSFESWKDDMISKLECDVKRFGSETIKQAKTV